MGYAIAEASCQALRLQLQNRHPGLTWTVQTFDFDGDVEITANRGDESITLDYDDHSDIATISVDRNDVPAGGQVHITISDFQLNLDPTADDAWTLNADGTWIQQRTCYS